MEHTVWLYPSRELGEKAARESDKLPRHPDMKEMRCMTFTSKSATEILVAGMQRTMFVIDVSRGEIVKKVGCLALHPPTLG